MKTSNILNEWLAENGKRAVHLSRAANVSRVTAHKWLTGKANPSPEHAYALHEATGIPPEAFRKPDRGFGVGPNVIRSALFQKLMSVTQLARAIGVSRSTANRWLHGYPAPSDENIAKINEVLGLSISREDF